MARARRWSGCSSVRAVRQSCPPQVIHDQESQRRVEHAADDCRAEVGAPERRGVGRAEPQPALREEQPDDHPQAEADERDEQRQRERPALERFRHRLRRSAGPNPPRPIFERAGDAADDEPAREAEDDHHGGERRPIGLRAAPEESVGAEGFEVHVGEVAEDDKSADEIAEERASQDEAIVFHSFPSGGNSAAAMKGTLNGWHQITTDLYRLRFTPGGSG